MISFRFIGKKFTLYSCVAIVLTSILTDILPGYPITSDILLICVFGGLINGFAVSLCLFAGATSGGTDFIAIFFPSAREKKPELHSGGQCADAGGGRLFVQLGAGAVFHHFSVRVDPDSQRAVQPLSKADLADYNGGASAGLRTDQRGHSSRCHAVSGVGCYEGKERKLLYSVVSRQEKRRIVSKIREIDPKAFINVVKTEQVTGRFYLRPND